MTTVTSDTIAAQVKEVNRLLQAGEPGNISIDTFSDFTGYKPQPVIEAMNAAFGYGGWGFGEISSHLSEDGKLAVSQVQVWLAGVEFKPTGWGQARITKSDEGDARKGAQTDAIKKALSYFSIGNRAYLGLLPGGKPKGNTNANTSHTKQGSTASIKPSPDALVGKDKAISLYNYAYKLKLIPTIHEWQQLKANLLEQMVPDEKMTQAQYDMLCAELAKRKEASVQQAS